MRVSCETDFKELAVQLTAELQQFGGSKIQDFHHLAAPMVASGFREVHAGWATTVHFTGTGS